MTPNGKTKPWYSQLEMLDKYKMGSYLAVVCFREYSKPSYLGVMYLCYECTVKNRFKGMEVLNRHESCSQQPIRKPGSYYTLLSG